MSTTYDQHQDPDLDPLVQALVQLLDDVERWGFWKGTMRQLERALAREDSRCAGGRPSPRYLSHHLRREAAALAAAGIVWGLATRSRKYGRVYAFRLRCMRMPRWAVYSPRNPRTGRAATARRGPCGWEDPRILRA
jgi:hypothetical protein